MKNVDSRGRISLHKNINERGRIDPQDYIDNALADGQGPSNGIHEYKIGRKGQSIMTAVAMDNVKLAMPMESSVLDTDGFRGGPENLKHSLSGVSAVGADDVGAAGPVRTK